MEEDDDGQVRAGAGDALAQMLSADELKAILAEHLTAKSCILYDPATKKILFSRSPFRAMPPASLTKILTAYVTLRQVRDLDECVTVKRNIHIGRGGVKPASGAGDRITVRDLYAAMLYPRTMCRAAEHVCLVPEFAAMNATARRLGVINSNFVNPNGMPDNAHVSTAYDLALLSAAAMRDPVFAEIVGTKRHSISLATTVEKRATKKQAKKLGVKPGALLSCEKTTRSILLKNPRLLGKYAGIRASRPASTNAAGSASPPTTAPRARSHRHRACRRTPRGREPPRLPEGSERLATKPAPRSPRSFRSNRPSAPPFFRPPGDAPAPARPREVLPPRPFYEADPHQHGGNDPEPDPEAFFLPAPAAWA
jgi:hypothetical protein